MVLRHLALQAGAVLAVLAANCHADVYAEFDLESPLGLDPDGHVYLGVDGVNFLGELDDGQYDATILVDYDGLPLFAWQGVVTADRSWYYEDGMPEWYDLSITFDFGGLGGDFVGSTTFSLADIYPVDEWNPDYSYGLPSWTTVGEDGPHSYMVWNIEETTVPAPAGLALLAMAVAPRRRRRH